jgi:succinate-acetate transporter protein
MATATCCFLLGLFEIQAKGVTAPNVMVGVALAYGGVGQLIVGCQEWACGNTFGATVFSTYGAFWIGHAGRWTSG